MDKGRVFFIELGPDRFALGNSVLGEANGTEMYDPRNWVTFVVHTHLEWFEGGDIEDQRIELKVKVRYIGRIGLGGRLIHIDGISEDFHALDIRYDLSEPSTPSGEVHVLEMDEHEKQRASGAMC